MTEATRNRMQRQLPNGEFVWVDIPEDFKAEMTPLNVPIQSAQIAGQNGCPHCGQVFVSSGVLQTHITAFHLLASGQADMRAVELPDGTSVPLSSVPEMLEDAKKDKADAIAVLEENERLKKKVAELEAFAGETIANQTKPTRRGPGRPRKS